MHFMYSIHLFFCTETFRKRCLHWNISNWSKLHHSFIHPLLHCGALQRNRAFYFFPDSKYTHTKQIPLCSFAPNMILHNLQISNWFFKHSILALLDFSSQKFPPLRFNKLLHVWLVGRSRGVVFSVSTPCLF